MAAAIVQRAAQQSFDMLLNFLASGRSDPVLMLRRFVVAMLIVGLGAGLMAPGHAGSAGMDCEQVSLQFDIGCAGGNIAATLCSVPCPAGACTAPAALVRPQAMKAGALQFVEVGAQASDSVLSPDTAPPKQSIV
jgi:hypothetical protein